MRKDLTIGIVGAGGDGVVVLGGIILKIAAGQGYYAFREQHTEAQIRGGGSAVRLCLKTESVLMPADELDILVCFNWEKYLVFIKELPIDERTIVFYDGLPPAELKLPARSFEVSFSQNKNIAALGFLAKVLSLPPKEAEKIIDEDIARGKKDLLEKSLAALKLGESLFDETKHPKIGLPILERQSPKIVLHGNEAAARGAIKAGCRFAASYPITPGTEATDYLKKELERIGGVYIQAEDEIASMGLVMGASSVGVKAIDVTSGPGLDLKTEMIGLGVTAEIPLVLINVQRGGPSTGIPAKTEQSDLNQAIYGGHGDAPRVVLAPYNLEGCYELTIEAFNIAERFQVPVILLSDQWLGQTLVAADDDFLKKEPVVVGRKKPNETEKNNYRRYLVTPDFVSPMANAGDEGFTYQTRGLSHNERGEPAQDHEASQLMHDKRWKKLLPLKEREDLVKIFGNQKSKVGIIVWGSTGQAILGALKASGLEDRVKVCIPELIYPLPTTALRKFLKPLKKLLVVELNYSGQFYRYLTSQVDLPKKRLVYQRAGGRPFGFKELIQKIEEALQ